MRSFIGFVLLCLAAAFGVFWYVTQPTELAFDVQELPQGDPAAGALVFAAAGCASCHKGLNADAEGPPVLSGGKAFPSDFGTFYASNISSDPNAGIGDWTFDQFARAVTQGVSPDGRHYYPAFPYASYSLMVPEDVADLYAYITTLPASDKPNTAHDVPFPFSNRRAVGLWKTLYVPNAFHLAGVTDPQVTRGRYLVEALSHCADCHTPRDALGGLNRDLWMTGAPDPAGQGRIPGILPSQLQWSATDITAYLSTGFTPGYDSAGGDMVDVIENLAKLPDDDRAAIAAYLIALEQIR